MRREARKQEDKRTRGLQQKNRKILVNAREKEQESRII
jgi:hypothetical protein